MRQVGACGRDKQHRTFTQETRVRVLLLSHVLGLLFYCSRNINLHNEHIARGCDISRKTLRDQGVSEKKVLEENCSLKRNCHSCLVVLLIQFKYNKLLYSSRILKAAELQNGVHFNIGLFIASYIVIAIFNNVAPYFPHRKYAALPCVT